MAEFTKGETGYHIQQVFPCSCEVRHYRDDSYGITYCSKHKAAPAMYEALKKLVTEGGDLSRGTPNFVKQALSKAEGRTP